MKTVLKPGILVSLKTAMRGNIHYDRRDLTPDAEEANGAEAVSKWETVKRIDDVTEHERATEARNYASTTIRRECQPTAFGLLCPTDNEEALDTAVAEARRVAGEFNASAQRTHVEVYVLKGRIAETDEEATRALVAEIKGLLDDMEQGIRDLDPEKIRKAATAAKYTAAMLVDDQNQAVGEAIKAARQAARQIVKRVEKAGEQGDRVLMDISTKPIDEARFAFLDLEPETETPGAALPPVSAERFEVDMDPCPLDQFVEDDDPEPTTTTTDDTDPGPQAVAATPNLFDMEV